MSTNNPRYNPSYIAKMKDEKVKISWWEKWKHKRLVKKAKKLGV